MNKFIDTMMTVMMLVAVPLLIAMVLGLSFVALSAVFDPGYAKRQFISDCAESRPLADCKVDAQELYPK